MNFKTYNGGGEVSKTTVNINGEEYIIGEKYWFCGSDKKNAEEKIFQGIRHFNNEIQFMVDDVWSRTYIYKTKPIDELTELKQAIKALDRIEDIKDYKKKIRSLVNKESLVIPHNEIGRTTVTLENTFIIETTPNFHGNLPKDK
jgi:ABC-type oligopeptide transport system substrate-binding subunit